MEFRNPTTFAQFVSANDLARLDGGFIHLIHCINNYGASCNCQKREDKQKMYDVCTKMYINLAKHVVGKFKTEFLSKTTDRNISIYTEQGQLITIVSR